MRIPIVIVAVSCFSAAFVSFVNAQSESQPPVKIICIGDSITQGGNVNEQEYTFRLPLYRLLRQKGINVDFIGTRSHGLNENFHWPDDFDPDHEGFYGASTDEVRQQLSKDLPKLPAPDIAIIDLGSNDQGKEIGKAVIAPLTDIVSQLRARNPDVKILIIQIPGVFKNFSMHFLVWRMALELSQPRSPLITIPLYIGWDTYGDTFEGAHPNIRGQDKIAAALISEMEPLLKSISTQTK